MGMPAAMDISRCLLGELLPDLGQHGGGLVGLDRENDHLRELSDVRVERGGLCAHLFRKRLRCRLAGIAGDDLGGGDKAGADESPGQRSGHLAGTEKTNGQLRSHAGF